MTVDEIITAAYGLSSKNRAEQIANRAVELLGVVNRSVRRLFQFGARVNPEFFSAEIDVAPAGGKWARPATAELIWRVEKVDGTEVAVVPRRDMLAEEGLPSIYALGQSFYTVGRTLGATIDPDAAADHLVFLAAQRSVDAAAVADPVDPLWPTSHDALLVQEVGVYLALKDGRLDEVAVLKPERDMLALSFAHFLEHETACTRVRYGAQRTFTLPSLLTLLAGNANADV